MGTWKWIYDEFMTPVNKRLDAFVTKLFVKKTIETHMKPENGGHVSLNRIVVYDVYVENGQLSVLDNKGNWWIVERDSEIKVLK